MAPRLGNTKVKRTLGLRDLPHGKHVQNYGEDSHNFLVLFGLIKFVHLQISLSNYKYETGKNL